MGDAASTNNPGESLNLFVKNSILLAKGDFSSDIICKEGANGSSYLTINHSMAGASRQTVDAGCSASGTAIDGDAVALTDLFVSPQARDFRLRPAPNPAFEAGDPATICDQSFDLLGNPRCVNSLTLLPEDGTIDIGAVEYQNYRPEKPVVTAPTSGMTGDSLAFSATGSDANGDPLTYNWKFGDGQIGTGSAVSHSYAAAGVYSVELRANDGTSDSDPVTASIVISASPVEPSFATLTLAKASGKFKFKKRAKLSNGFKAVAKKPKVAFVLATSSQSLSGKITLLSSKGKTLKGSQKITLRAGKSYLTFGGKWNKKVLPKGRYTLKFTSSALKDAKKSVLSIVR